MSRWLRRVLGVTLGILLISWGTSLPAWAADTTPPRLTLLPFAAFRQGGQIGPSAAPTGSKLTFTDGIPLYMSWSGSDVSGICGYDVWAVYVGSGPSLLVSRTLKTGYNGTTTDYVNQYGGGGVGILDHWNVVAHDCAGNTTTKSAFARPTVTQEDGTSNGYATARIAYTGTWGTSYATVWSHGAVRKSSQRGATASISYPFTAANSTVALVMEKAPNRGKFTLIVDGVNRGTVDTYATVATHRVIVWSGRVSTAGNHVIKIVNQATAGRPRIDLDAVLLNTPYTYSSSR